jgi:hypothetical protein
MRFPVADKEVRVVRAIALRKVCGIGAWFAPAMKPRVRCSRVSRASIWIFADIPGISSFRQKAAGTDTLFHLYSPIERALKFEAIAVASAGLIADPRMCGRLAGIFAAAAMV